MQLSVCALCERDELGGIARVSGLDLCEDCRFDPRPALARRGVSHSAEVDRQRNPNSNTTTYVVTDHWTLPATTGAHASFGREDWLDRVLLNRFRDELTTGDAVFDDAVLIRTDTRDRTRALLDEGTQSAVLGLVGGYGVVVIDGPNVQVRHVGGNEGDATPDRGESAALLFHLLRQIASNS